LHLASLGVEAQYPKAGELPWHSSRQCSADSGDVQQRGDRGRDQEQADSIGIHFWWFGKPGTHQTGHSTVERLIDASPCKPVRCPARGSKSSVETRGNSGTGCRGRAVAGGDRRRGGILDGRYGSLRASMTLRGGRCLRQCGLERTRVPEGDYNGAWSCGSPSQRQHAVVALVAIEEQSGKMGWKREGAKRRGNQNQPRHREYMAGSAHGQRRTGARHRARGRQCLGLRRMAGSCRTRVRPATGWPVTRWLRLTSGPQLNSNFQDFQSFKL
jgi:hypothetical protein